MVAVLSVFVGAFGKQPKASSNKRNFVRMGQIGFDKFSAEWAKQGLPNNKSCGFFYNNSIGILEFWW